MRGKDWASTPLGDAGEWPQSLRTSVSICLNSRMPVLVWRIAREDVPDLALLDIGLPVIDGYELAQRLRAEHPSLRLVAVSGYGQDADRAAALRAGFSRHLVKPVSLEEIESVVTGDAARAP